MIMLLNLMKVYKQRVQTRLAEGEEMKNDYKNLLNWQIAGYQTKKWGNS